jgi:hypothetical protein
VATPSRFETLRRSRFLTHGEKQTCRAAEGYINSASLRRHADDIIQSAILDDPLLVNPSLRASGLAHLCTKHLRVRQGGSLNGALP